MWREDLLRDLNAVFSELEVWWNRELTTLDRPDCLTPTEGFNRLRSEYADRLERALEPFILEIEQHSPGFAREFREKNRLIFDGLRIPVKPEGWLH